jgi:hypothetical protein
MKVAILLVFWVGCSGEPCDHCANWWYYWQGGDEVDLVVHDMDKVKYMWDPGDYAGVSSPHKTQDIVGVSDLALNTISPYPHWDPKRVIPRIVTNKYNPTKTVLVIAVRDGGVHGAAEVIAHEFKHIWVYQQWGAKVGQTGMINGFMHSDGDCIPDIVETDTSTPQSFGNLYDFHIGDADTFDCEHYLYSVYAALGDNEILAREEGINNPRAIHPGKDWSKGGKQWRH